MVCEEYQPAEVGGRIRGNSVLGPGATRISEPLRTASRPWVLECVTALANDSAEGVRRGFAPVNVQPTH